jgi:hypothetical protein
VHNVYINADVRAGPKSTAEGCPLAGGAQYATRADCRHLEATFEAY